MAKHIPSLFLTPDELENNIIENDNFHHLIKVLRLKENSRFFALDNKGNKFTCTIEKINKNNAEYNVSETETSEPTKLSITLIQAITKIETFEEIIDKAVQQGVDTIIPLITKNVSASLDLFNKKTERFNKIVKSSCEQSERFFLPILAKTINIEDFKNSFKPEETLIAYEKSDLPMKNILESYKNEKITVVCGPEGGFADEEISILSEYPLVSLGKNILRAETAATVIIGNIIYELNT